MMESMNLDVSPIMTIPGIGYINGGMILGEIGEVHRFSKPHQLLANTGLGPSVKQSAFFNASRTRMSKRGSKVLRYALINAAHIVVKNSAYIMLLCLSYRVNLGLSVRKTAPALKEIHNISISHQMAANYYKICLHLHIAVY